MKIKKVVKKVLEELKLKGLDNSGGLCTFARDLMVTDVLTLHEYRIFKEYIYERIKNDNWYNRLFFNKAIIKTYGHKCMWFFKPHEVEPRVKFLEYLIK